MLNSGCVHALMVNIYSHYRLFNKFFLHNLTNDENLKIATNILDESKSTSINDLQVHPMYLCML